MAQEVLDRCFIVYEFYMNIGQQAGRVAKI